MAKAAGSLRKNSSIQARYINRTEGYEPKMTHIFIDSLSESEKIKRVQQAYKDIEGGVEQGTIKNPSNLASTQVSHSDKRTYIQAAIDAIKTDRAFVMNDGYYAIDIDSQRIYVDVISSVAREIRKRFK